MTHDYFARIDGRVNVDLLSGRSVVVVGVGTVGSQVARELANSGVGELLLIDDDYLELSNLIRHALPKRFLIWNKAEALATYLPEEVPGLHARAEPIRIGAELSDDKIDHLFRGANLIVAATDDREAQQRIGRRALALTIPTVFPGLYRDGGGEVIVQLDPSSPCFFCWDGYRPNDDRLRAVSALNVDAVPIIQLAVRLSLGLLDPHSEHGRLLVGDPDRPHQSFVLIEQDAPLDRGPLVRRPNCPSCAVGPASQSTGERRASAPVGSWTPRSHRPLIDYDDAVLEHWLSVQARARARSQAQRDRPPHATATAGHREHPAESHSHLPTSAPAPTRVQLVPPVPAQAPISPSSRPLIDYDDIAEEARNVVVMIVVGIAALAFAYGVFRLVVKLIGLLIVQLLNGLAS